MSTHNGAHNEDAFLALPVGVEAMPQLLSQHRISASTLPTQTLLMGTPYISPQAQPQQQQQPPAPPPPAIHQHYNEYYYNTYATQPGHPETYSVLPVGHGNFLKVYHCQENATAVAAAVGMSNETNALYHAQTQSQQFHHQTQPTYHMRKPQSQPPQYFNSYELFSSNTLMSTPDNQTTLGRTDMKTSAPHMSPQAPILMLNNHEEPLMQQTSNTTPTTNMIINKLVSNWSPNVTGAPIQQLPMQTPTVLFSPEPSSNFIKGPEGSNMLTTTNDAHFTAELLASSTVSAATNLTQTMPVLPATQKPPIVMSSSKDQNECKETATDVANTSINVTLIVPTPTTHLNTTPEGKKRIVAEVKPMRMSYSDVLSKMNNQQLDSTQFINNSINNASGKNGKTSVGERKVEKNVAENGHYSGVSRRPMSMVDEGSALGRAGKKSPIHENKENIQQLQTGIKNNKRSNNSVNINSTSCTQLKQGQKSNQKSNIADNGINKANNVNSNGGKKRINNKRGDIDINKNEMNSAKSPKSNIDKDFNGYYNIAAKTNASDERGSRATNNVGFVPISVNNSNSSSSTTTARKSNKSASSFNTTTSNTSTTFNTNQSRTRYNNTNTNSSYSYSSKRSKNAHTSYGNMSAASSNRNYELAKKFLRAWLEYTIMALTWLFYLIYDIVVLGCSVAYDRLLHACECGIMYAHQLRKDFKQNSNKPGIWLKNYWRKFDARFKKNSQWAFWRRFYQKKPPEPTTENMKNGRLPQTGEEAMYLLLNCKGKDAYSILGVPPDSSQEQIRKHYKKIAVLVHPDKNKQAGAEEAFKILQRAFELIGQPEKRLAYDQSLAEALHAEKAWTELHDLISQLQTKITEAANTIRCSTCGLRHPRRLTDRPHYAARECASCKIRHSAREGDIWAETSMLGLRWRYLALMEGKVYDITEWANCQKGALSHLEPNSHMVQYRIVRGAQQQQTPQQQQHHQQQPSAYAHHSPHHQNAQQPYTQQPGAHHERNSSGKFKRNIPPSEASLHDFLDNLYGGQHPNPANVSSAYSNPSRRRTRRN
ncbi:uncharacterized protein [Eurosta solidaginis]|uniref:uncharacterized protein n=1 Tax=Eurosta solidaginis TaxID=178769 RepID=UPI003531297C